MTQTKFLLAAISRDFPRRKKEFEQLHESAGIHDEPVYEARDPEVIFEMPTFALGVSRPLSPMLTIRFQTFGSITMGPDTWLAVSEIQSAICSLEIMNYHKSLREHVVDSFPALYPDHQLSLFGYSPGVFDSAVYLAWKSEKVEPRVAAYSGYERYEFLNVDLYLTWVLTRE